MAGPKGSFRRAQLPADNRQPLTTSTFLAPVNGDPLASPQWRRLTLAPAGDGKATLSMPADLHGRYLVKITTASSAEPPAQDPLAVQREFWIEPANAAGYVAMSTPHGRTGFAPGEDVRVVLSASAKPAWAASKMVFVLKAADDREVARLPVEFPAIAAGKSATAIVKLPPALTRWMSGMTCKATLADLPAGVGADAITIAFGPAVRITDFEIGLFGINGTVNLKKQAASALLHEEMGATHAIHPDSNQLPTTYLDVATRLGLRYYLRPYGHFAACNWLPNEDGPMRVRMANWAQRLAHYPSAAGINYHDLYAPFGTWWDAPRKAGYDIYWKDWGAKIEVPSTVPEAAREKFRTRMTESLTMPRATSNGARRSAAPIRRGSVQRCNGGTCR